MEFLTPRAIFFAPPAEGAPTPTAFTGTPAPARRLRDGIEPLAGVSIWSEEAAARYVEQGLDDWFAAYVWQRVSALGTPPTPLAVTGMGVWPANLIGQLYEAAAAVIPRDEVIRARIDGAGHTLRRRVGDIDDDAARVVTASRRGIDAADTTARPMFSGLSADPWPGDILAQLVHACHLRRAHRGDSHLAVCALAGLDPVEMNLLTGVYCGYPIFAYGATRTWSQEQQAAADRPRARGLVDGEARALRGCATGPVWRHRPTPSSSRSSAMGPDLDIHIKQLDSWSNALIATDGAPSDPAKRAAG
jgi:hypothetical protein